MDLLTAEEGACAVRLARSVLEQKIGGTTFSPNPLAPIFNEKRGVFVTLTENGELRGCIGFPYPTYPLGEAIREAAVSAALQDPRFPPVRASELPCIRVEVT
ncbi:MAG: TIGR00296 family protein, partial [Methanomicrobiales archaeon]|nr:TIGR00296 family protein [Methanomicrobiales archaeon]